MTKKITALAAMLGISGCSFMLPEGSGAPVGASARAGDYIATLIQIEEPRIPSLHHRPELDRYRLSLLLHSIDGRTRRMVRIASGLRASDYIHGARFLGDDGRLIWFQAHETVAYDYRADKLLIGRTLPKVGEPRRARLFDDTQPSSFLERTDRFGAQYTRAAFVLSAVGKAPLRLSGPDGVLITYRSKPGLNGTVALSRLEDSGKVVWAVDTDLRDLDQILPDSRSTAFIGKKPPKVQDEFRPPMLVLVNNESGAISTHSLSMPN